MDTDLVLFGCQNNERAHLQGTAKNLNRRFRFRVQLGILPLCSALENPRWDPVSSFRHYLKEEAGDFQSLQESNKVICLNVSHRKQ